MCRLSNEARSAIVKYLSLYKVGVLSHQAFNNDGIYFKGLEERDSHVLALFLIAT